MEYTQLGTSDLKVSRICLGCMGLGDAGSGQHSWTIDEERGRAVIRRALDLGINFFDTALAYQGGTSEQYLGRALRDMAHRDEVVVATKFLPRTPAEVADGVSGQQHIMAMLDRSLANLGMDHVDLYICHMWDYNTPLLEIMGGLTQAVQSGKARYVGISNCFAWQLAKANLVAYRYRFVRFVAAQSHYNLIAREDERELAPCCKDGDIAMTPYSPLAGGRLARLPGATSRRLAEDSYARLKYDPTAREDAVIIERVARLAERRGVSMAEVSLSWLLGKVTAPVVGATKPEHVEGAARAVGLRLTADETACLEEPYVPHRLVGVMAQNTPESKDQPHVWSPGGQQ